MFTSSVWEKLELFLWKPRELPNLLHSDRSCPSKKLIGSLYPQLANLHPLTCENAYFCKFGEILAAELLAPALEAILRGARKSDFYRPILEKFHNVPELEQVRLITGYAPPISLRSA